jgi:hypothetical protein
LFVYLVALPPPSSISSLYLHKLILASTMTVPTHNKDTHDVSREMGSQVTSGLEDNDVTSSEHDVKVPLLLQRGTPMTKVSKKKTKTIVFRIDADEGCILWESKKSGISSHTSLISYLDTLTYDMYTL